MGFEELKLVEQLWFTSFRKRKHSYLSPSESKLSSLLLSPRLVDWFLWFFLVNLECGKYLTWHEQSADLRVNK